MKKIILSLIFSGAFFSASAQTINVKEFKNNLILHDDSVVFPITLVNAYPFVSGEVNGVKGKFMFDTGLEAAIAINDHLVKLPAKKSSGNGIVGSGQKFVINKNDTISEVKFENGYVYHKLLNIKSANYDFLEDITPDCLGYVGFNFFKEYLVKIDYLRRRLTFYKNTDERKKSRDFLKGERILAVLNFTTRKLPNHPLVNVKIGKVSVLGAFDTGQFGLLQLDTASYKNLAGRSLVVPAGTSSDEDSLVTVNQIMLDGKFKTALSGIPYVNLTFTQPQRNGLGITEPNLMNFGYRFLAEYKTVWDYFGKKLYILQR